MQLDAITRLDALSFISFTQTSWVFPDLEIRKRVWRCFVFLSASRKFCMLWCSVCLTAQSNVWHKLRNASIKIASNRIIHSHAVADYHVGKNLRINEMIPTTW